MWSYVYDQIKLGRQWYFLLSNSFDCLTSIWCLVVRTETYEILYCVIPLIPNSVICSSCQHIRSEALYIFISITCLSVRLSVFDGDPLGDYSKCQTYNICQNVSTLDNLSTTGQITEPLWKRALSRRITPDLSSATCRLILVARVCLSDNLALDREKNKDQTAWSLHSCAQCIQLLTLGIKRKKGWIYSFSAHRHHKQIQIPLGAVYSESMQNVDRKGSGFKIKSPQCTTSHL